MSNHIIEIRDWIFESNSALNGDGGSLYLACPDFTYCEYDVYGNSFVSNTASISGGAIKWNDIIPFNLSLNTFDDNSAIYGNDIASYPIAI